MLQNLKLFLFFSRYFNSLKLVFAPPKKGLPLNLTLNSIIQALSLTVQYANQAADFLPPKGKFWLAVGVTGIQGITALLAHFRNPDGTTAALPYTSPPTLK